MTRLFTTGWEMGDEINFSGYEGGTIDTTYENTGDFDYEVGYPFTWAFKIFADSTEIYFKEWVRISDIILSYSWRPIQFRHSNTALWWVGFDALGHWTVNNADGLLGTSPNYCTLHQDTWYCIEVHLKIDAAGVFVLQVDGNTVINFSGDTRVSGGSGHTDNLYWAQIGTDRVMYIDDVALNDTNGVSDNSWCGAGRITKIIPVGDGSLNEWVNSSGDSVNNWSYVDEYPADGDTSYVRELASATGDRDQYEMSDDYDGTDRVITRLWAECRARKTAAGEAAALNIGFDTGLSVTLDPVDLLYVTYTFRCIGAEYTVNPDDSFPWEEADIDALQFVAEVG